MQRERCTHVVVLSPRAALAVLVVLVALLMLAALLVLLVLAPQAAAAGQHPATPFASHLVPSTETELAQAQMEP